MKKIIFVVIVLMSASLTMIAQPADFEPVVDQPVNGWIIILLAIGVGYGLKKLYHSKVKQ